MSYQNTLPKNFEKIIEETEKKSREVGLDFFTTVFELVDYKKLHEAAAYGGLPKRYPHWRWGMEYDRLMKSYQYGLATIYEMVINNDPCYAYLLDSNHLSTQKTVIAHVYGHSDFFKNNIWFAQTNRKMLDQAANNGSIIREIMREVDHEEVESFIDTCLSLENLLDPSKLFHYPKEEKTSPEERKLLKIQKKEKYLENFLNDRCETANLENNLKIKKISPLEQEERDILKFLYTHADLPSWKVKIMQIIRSEAYYFLPQRNTKILNEGWATFWHSKMMTELHPLNISEIVDYCCQYASIVEEKNQQINPYKLGLELLKYIDEKSSDGHKKIFEIRKLHNDLSFVDNFMDEDFCHEKKMFLYDYDENHKKKVPNGKDFKKIKSEIIASLTNCGWPIIKITDNNFQNRGELLLKHSFDGNFLHQGKTLETLKRLYSIWRKPVHIESTVGTVPKIFSFDGNETSITKL